MTIRSNVVTTFTVAEFTPVALPEDAPAIRVAMPADVSTMVKTYAGPVSGRSLTLFTAAFDQARGCGTYVAMELFEGSVEGRSGTFAFVHSASTKGPGDRTDEVGRIVPQSGTGELAGIKGTVRLAIDGTSERMFFDYSL